MPCPWRPFCCWAALPRRLAAEGDAELSLYQQYGPWGEWPQEQKDAAEETWTDGQWDDYWTEYDAQMWAALNRYNEDYDRWNYARFGDPWDEYLRVEKEEMGMPYPDGINVSLNGAYLDFGGTAPLAASGVHHGALPGLSGGAGGGGCL